MKKTLKTVAPVEDKKNAIIEAYLVVAEREGVQNVTLQKVAAEAGVAYSTVHYYFGKDDSLLIDAVIEYVARTSEEYLDSSLKDSLANPDVNGLAVYLEAKYLWNKRFPTYASMFGYATYLATRDSKYKAVAGEYYKQASQRLTSLLIQEIGKGRYERLKNVKDVGHMLHKFISSETLMWLTTNLHNRDSVKQALDVVEGIIRTFGVKT